jgi:hypothetical protein
MVIVSSNRSLPNPAARNRSMSCSLSRPRFSMSVRAKVESAPSLLFDGERPARIASTSAGSIPACKPSAVWSATACRAVGHCVSEEDGLNLRLGKVAAVNFVENADEALDEHRRCRHSPSEVGNYPESGLHASQCRFGGFGSGVDRVDREAFHWNCLSNVMRTRSFRMPSFSPQSS